LIGVLFVSKCKSSHQNHLLGHDLDAKIFQMEWQCYQLTNSVYGQFYAKKRQNQLKKPKKQILVALLWQFFAIKFALKQGHK
jgi:hypothetical protein